MSTLSVAEAATRLKIHQKTLLHLIATGAIPAARIGRSYVMLEEDIMNHIKNQIVIQTRNRNRLPEAGSQITATQISVA